MSNRYVMVARVGKKLGFFALSTNACVANLRATGYRMLRAWHGSEPIEILLISPSPFQRPPRIPA
jgi:hypothetical protein